MTIEELSARLEKVERANRRMRAVGGLVLVLAAAGAAIGQAAPPPKLIQAERFELLGRRGAVIGTFGNGQAGESPDQPHLVLSGKDDGGGALLSVTDGIPTLQLHGPSWTVTAGSLFDLKNPRHGVVGGVSVHGETVQPLLRLAVDSEGAPALVVFDKGGKVLERLPK